MADYSKDAEVLYHKLEQSVMPSCYYIRDDYLDVMRHAIALNGPYFNAHPMLQQYVLKAYFQS